MTNEQEKIIRGLAKLLDALANKKTIQFNHSEAGWQDKPALSIKSLCDHYLSGTSIRVKPETKRVALTQQDLIDRELRKDTMRVKFNGASMLITDFNDTGAWISGEKHEYDAFMFCYVFLDGTPCYKEVEYES